NRHRALARVELRRAARRTSLGDGPPGRRRLLPRVPPDRPGASGRGDGARPHRTVAAGALTVGLIGSLGARDRSCSCHCFTAFSQGSGLRCGPMGTDEAAEGVRILVVDDEENITDLVATALRYERFEVEVAHTGRQAMRAVSSFRPDLIVLDVMLP